jgi:cyanophycinase
LRVLSFRLQGAFLALALGVAGSALGGERLVVIGGGDRPKEALSRFVEWAGGPVGSRILVISWASGEPKESFESLRDDLTPFKPEAVEEAASRPLTASGKTASLGQLRRATGVFFTGGDQARIMEASRRGVDRRAARTLQGQGGLRGTSAGAAIMSERMITGKAITVIDAAKVESGRASPLPG